MTGQPGGQDPIPHRHPGLHVLARAKRAARLATAPWRPLPDTLLIGGIRCGSTSLHDWLVEVGYQHPGVDRKVEVHYFDRNAERGERWYRAWYPLRGTGPAIDSSPSYLCTPGVAERAADLLPDATVLAVLRHPAARAASHFAWRRARGHEPLPTIEEALADEPRRRAAGEVLGCYRLHSDYAPALRAWERAFGPDRVHAFVSEQLFANDPEELARLGAACGIAAPPPFPRSNVGPEHETDPWLVADLAPIVAEVEELLGRPTGWGR
ncbi:MAG: hypothetical protein U0P45_02510 [Acidimicrobiales bacterium]